MSRPQRERLALFIDGASLHATARSLGFDVDYRKLLKEYQGRGRLVRATYYTAVADERDCSAMRPLIDWLAYNGYRAVTKPAREVTDPLGRRKAKGTLDIELAIDALEMAGFIDHMILFSGNGDFRPLVAAVQRRGIRVSVVSTILTQPAMIADELRRQADAFEDVAALVPMIGRDPDHKTLSLPERRATDLRPAATV